MQINKELISEIRIRIQLLITISIFFITFLGFFYKAIGSDNLISYKKLMIFGIGIAFCITNYFLVGLIRELKKTLIWIHRFISINILFFVLPIILFALVVNKPQPSYYKLPFIISLNGLLYMPFLIFLYILIILYLQIWKKNINKTKILFKK